MHSEIVIVHSRERLPLVELEGPGWVKWETCLRRIYFGNAKLNLRPGVEVYVGREAYRFCLEIVCGLHSPILGETEVWGQFKALFKGFDFSASQAPYGLQSFVEGIFTDAKLIRSRFLTGLGSQSYGSQARRLLKGETHLHILGSGQLVQEMLPWLVKSAQSVQLYCRNYESGQTRINELKAQSLREKTVQREWLKTKNQAVVGSLVIVAPIPAREIEQAFARSRFNHVIDLRAESQADPLTLWPEAVTLKQFFSEIEQSKKGLSEVAEEARQAIAALAKQRFDSVQIRPYGWDDLCV